MFRHIKFILLFLVTVNAIQAVDIPDSMQKVLDKSGGDNEKIKILLSASTTAHPDPELGSLYARMALNLSLKTNDRKSVAQSYYNIGANAYLNNTVKESHSNFLKASVIFDSLHDVGAMAKTYSALGDVLGDEGDSKKSIEYYNLAKSDFFMNRDTLNALYMDMSIAAILAMSGKFDSALAYSISSLPAARKFKNENLISKLLANIGGIYGAMGKNKEALDYFLQTLPYFEKKNTLSEKADAYTNISETYFKLKDYKNSKKYALLAYKTSRGAKYKRGALSASKVLARACSGLNEYSEASQWYEIAFAVKDSLYSEDMTKQIAEMQTKYETVKKEKAISELRKNEEIKNTQLSRQRTIIYSSIAILLLILSGVILLYNNNRKISRLNKALEELNIIKNKLLGIISHDLRNPLMTIDATIKMLRQGGLSEEQIQKFTANLEASMTSTLALIDNLLAWALSQMEGAKFDIEKLDIKEAVDENMELYKNVAGFKNINLHSDLLNTVYVQTDRNVMNFVIRNLLSNAIKFTKPGGTIEFSASKKSDQVILRIKDDGIGMEPLTLDKIFELGREKIKTGTAKEKGSGLGLTLCRDLLRKVNADISVESAIGKGTVFSVTFPANA